MIIPLNSKNTPMLSKYEQRVQDIAGVIFKNYHNSPLCISQFRQMMCDYPKYEDIPEDHVPVAVNNFRDSAEAILTQIAANYAAALEEFSPCTPDGINDRLKELGLIPDDSKTEENEKG